MRYVSIARGFKTIESPAFKYWSSIPNRPEFVQFSSTEDLAGCTVNLLFNGSFRSAPDVQKCFILEMTARYTCSRRSAGLKPYSVGTIGQEWIAGLLEIFGYVKEVAEYWNVSDVLRMLDGSIPSRGDPSKSFDIRSRVVEVLAQMVPKKGCWADFRPKEGPPDGYSYENIFPRKKSVFGKDARKMLLRVTGYRDMQMRKRFHAMYPDIPHAALPATCGDDAPIPSSSNSLPIPSSSIPLPPPPQLESSSNSEVAPVPLTTPAVSASSPAVTPVKPTARGPQAGSEQSGPVSHAGTGTPNRPVQAAQEQVSPASQPEPATPAAEQHPAAPAPAVEASRSASASSSGSSSDDSFVPSPSGGVGQKTVARISTEGPTPENVVEGSSAKGGADPDEDVIEVSDSAPPGVETSGRKVMPRRSTRLQASRSGRGGTAGGAVEVVELESAPEDAGENSILGKRNLDAPSATPEPSTKKRRLGETSSKSSSKKSKSASRGRSREPVLQFDDAQENPIPDSIVDENVAPFSPAQLRLAAG